MLHCHGTRMERPEMSKQCPQGRQCVIPKGLFQPIPPNFFALPGSASKLFDFRQVKVNIPREHSACQNVVIVGDAIDVSRGTPSFGRRAVELVELQF